MAGGAAGSPTPVRAAGAVKPPTSSWRVSADDEVTGNPVAVGDAVFFGTWSGTLEATTLHGGRVLWRRKLDGTGINGGALYDNGRLYAPTVAGRIFCVEPTTGRVLWATDSLFGPLKDALRASPRAYNGVLYESLGGTWDVRNEQGGVVALDERTGRVLWKTLLVHYAGGGAAVFGTPVVIPSLGELVVGTGNPTPFPGNGNPAGAGPLPAGAQPYADSLVALSLHDGHVLWSHQTHANDTSDYDFIAAPNVVTLTGGGIAVGDGGKDGSYYLFDARNGAELWQTSVTLPLTDTLIVSTSAVAHGRIFVGTFDVPDEDTTADRWPAGYQSPGQGRLLALDAGTGRVLWSTALPGALPAAPVATTDAVFAATANGTLVGLDAASGRVLWQTPSGGEIHNAEAALALADHYLLVPLSRPGGVAAFRLS